jgi:hypothetical protein
MRLLESAIEYATPLRLHQGQLEYFDAPQPTTLPNYNGASSNLALLVHITTQKSRFVVMETATVKI